MLELRKKKFFSNEYVAEENGAVVAELNLSVWRSQGELTIQGRSLKLKKRGALRDTFELLDGDTALIEVAQPSAWRFRLRFRYEQRDFEIVDKAWYSSTPAPQGGRVGCRQHQFEGSVRRRGEGRPARQPALGAQGVRRLDRDDSLG
ncbi:MAG: hypothetical protein IPH09_15725 [bacterium]|nr:hypothetical protein [bacterium]